MVFCRVANGTCVGKFTGRGYENISFSRRIARIRKNVGDYFMLLGNVLPVRNFKKVNNYMRCII